MKISDLTKKKTGPFVWTMEANEAFEILKNFFLAFPDMKSEEPLILIVDTSSVGVGYALSQRQISDHTGKYYIYIYIYIYRKNLLQEIQQKCRSHLYNIYNLPFSID